MLSKPPGSIKNKKKQRSGSSQAGCVYIILIHECFVINHAKSMVTSSLYFLAYYLILTTVLVKHQCHCYCQLKSEETQFKRI